MARTRVRPTIGWREWVELPDLGGAIVKAKIDTGARTSAIHAFGIESYDVDGEEWVGFDLHPVQRHKTPSVRVEARVKERRVVRSSNGVAEERYVIRTVMDLGVGRYPLDLTLANRDQMGFRMLLGRRALRNRFLIDPSRSYLLHPGPGEP